MHYNNVRIYLIAIWIFAPDTTLRKSIFFFNVKLFSRHCCVILSTTYVRVNLSTCQTNQILTILVINIFFAHQHKDAGFKYALSKVWLQRRLIGVKSVEEGDRISPLGGYTDNCWNRKVDYLPSD